MGNRFIAAIVFVLILSPVSGVAQRAVGVDWKVPKDVKKASADLRFFSSLGISHLQVKQNLSPRLWQLVTDSGLTVWAMLPIEFAVTQTFTKADSSFLSATNSLARQFNSQAAVHSIGLYWVGATYDQSFYSAVSSFAATLRPNITKPLYAVEAELPQQKLHTEAGKALLLTHNGGAKHNFSGYIYRPTPNEPWNLKPVKTFIEKTGERPQSPIFFPSGWLKKMIQHHPDFAETLHHYATSAEPAFPLPQHHSQMVDSNTIVVVMLLLAWFIFGAIYSYNPIYRKSFMRYVTGHRFFVEDVMQRHIRELFTGSIILIQHAIAGGIILYSVASTLFTAFGYQAIQAHYPWLGIFGDSLFGFFIWGVVITLACELLNVLWLWLVNPATKYFSQIINLYPWLLQINLIIATLSAAFLLGSGHPFFVYLLTALFIILFIASFILTAADTVQFVRKRKLYIYLGTVGVYLILLAGVLLWVLFSQKLLNVAELAARLP